MRLDCQVGTEQGTPATRKKKVIFYSSHTGRLSVRRISVEEVPKTTPGRLKYQE